MPLPKVVIGLAVAMGLAAAAAGQQPPARNGAAYFTAETRVVEIDVWAQDGHGNPVTGLTRADFSVFDNGRPRPFTIFTVNTGAPQPSVAAPASAPALPAGTYTNLGQAPQAQPLPSAVILLDAFNGWFENYGAAQQAVEQMLPKIPTDEPIALYVLTKAQGLVILQNYTLDRSRLLAAIKNYVPGGTCPSPVTGGGGSGGSDPEHTAVRNAMLTSVCQGTVLERPILMREGSDSVRAAFDALAQALAGQPGRKNVYWLTQGFPPRLLQGLNKNAWDKTISQLNDANVAVNTVDDDGLSTLPQLWGPGGIQTLQQMAQVTGGVAYIHRGDLGGALAQGITAAQSSYTLGFYLTETDGQYHTLRIAVDRPGVTLSYRQGYYAQEDRQRAVLKTPSDLAAVLLDPQSRDGVGITAKLAIVPAAIGGKVDLRLKLDPQTLTLQAGKGGADSWAGSVDEMFVQFNAAGREVGRVTDTKRWTLNGAQRPVFEAQGLNLDAPIPLAPGAVSLTLAIRDNPSGRIGSLTVSLKNP